MGGACQPGRRVERKHLESKSLGGDYDNILIIYIYCWSITRDKGNREGGSVIKERKKE